MLKGQFISGDHQCAGFLDLCYNYMQERLQNIFFKSQLEKLTEKEKGIAKVSRPLYLYK